jgi:hypothetical protein
LSWKIPKRITHILIVQNGIEGAKFFSSSKTSKSLFSLKTSNSEPSDFLTSKIRVHMSKNFLDKKIKRVDHAKFSLNLRSTKRVDQTKFSH